MLSNSFNVIVKSIAYSLLTLIILLFMSPKLVGWFVAGLTVLTLFSGALRGKTSKLNK